MNHVYRVVWNEALGSFVAVAEHETARGKSRPGQAARGRAPASAGGAFVGVLCSLSAAVALVLTLSVGQAWAEPSGGQVTAGAAGIQQSGSTTVITQTTPKVAIQWQRFDIERGETVRFDQPSAAAIALNRVIGTDGSRILGQLQANGQVFLINPNGILFGRSAQVDVGGLVASTLNLTDDDFLAGRYQFFGQGGSVRNEGRLQAFGDGMRGGSIALLGGQVSNTGEVIADRGSVALAAGNRVTLDFGGDGLLKLSVDEGTLKALVDNGGLLRADGGSVLMTARAADALRATVVNNTGIVQARTLENKAGVIKLLGGMDEATGGAVEAGGRLEASAPNGGDGGFVEASAYNVRLSPGLRVDTMAPQGKVGEFLIDPTDYVVAAGNAAITATGAGNETLQNQLESTSVLIATSSGVAGAGSITISAPLTWTSANTLSLQSRFGNGSIAIDAPVSFANGRLALDATGTITASAAVSGNRFTLISGTWRQVGSSLPTFSATNFEIQTAGAFIRALGGDGTVGNPYRLTDAYGLQGMGSVGMLGNSYRLANDIDASGTAAWNLGSGWKPVGDATTAFTGTLDGAGFTLSGLTIARSSTDLVGLIGQMSTGGQLKNLTLTNASITGRNRVGALVGQALDGSLEGLSASGSVSGRTYVGGIVGELFTTLTGGANAAAVTGSDIGSDVGGVVGRIAAGGGQVSGSYNTGTVTGPSNVGGVAGSVSGLLETSFNTGAVQGGTGTGFGGLVGVLNTTARDSYSLGAVSATGGRVGGAVGINNNGTLQRVYSTGLVSGASLVGGLVGSATVLASAPGSFWDTTSSGQSTSAGGVGKTTAELKTLSTFTGAGWTDIDDAGGTGKVWRIYGGNTTPLLRSFMTSLALTPDYDGSGVPLTNIGGTSLPVGTDASLLLGTQTRNALTLSSTAAGSYTATADTTGLYSTQLGYDIVGASRAIVTAGSAAGDLTLPNGVSWANGTLVIDTTGNIDAPGIIAGGAGSIFDLKAGSWRQVTGALPDFRVNDFRLSGGSFTRALGGDGTVGNPYQLTDVYGLQGMDGLAMLGLNYRLVNDIDASRTANWNAGLGWNPVGIVANVFTGVLEGGGFTVSGLSVARPTANNSGMFTGIDGTVRNLSLTGLSVEGDTFSGGLAGIVLASGTVSNVRVSGSVSGRQGVGGIAGGVLGTVTGAVNEADVTARENSAGGVAAFIEFGGLVSASYNTGTVTGGGVVAGVAGATTGTVENSFNTGTVVSNGGGTNDQIGGISGRVFGTIRDSYSTGTVNGSTATGVGGAIGLVAPAATVTRIYSTGAVSGGSSVGGLVGTIDGGGVFVSNDSFWNTTTSGLSTSAVGVGKTTAELQTLTTFTGAGWANIDSVGGAGRTWRLYAGNTTPLLRTFMTDLVLTPTYDGSGTLLADIGSYTVPVGTDTGLVLGAQVTNTLRLSTGVVGGRYTAAVELGGLYSTQLGYNLTGGSRVINDPGSAANDISLPNGIRWTRGLLAIDTPGTVTAAGAITGGTGSSFEMRNGTWRQVTAALPGFAVNDFRFIGGTFIRARAGDGSAGNPYQLADVFGLQGMGTSGMLGLNHVLANGIDASASANWYGGLGWKPVGDATTPFTGSLDGGDFAVSGLTIARPTLDDVGLIGQMGGTAQLKNLALTNVSVVGRNEVGGAVGLADGKSTIDRVSVAGSVSGGSVVGGVAGKVIGTVSGGINAAAVTATGNFAGGITGLVDASGQVSTSYNTGAVTGEGAVGGVAGGVSGLLETSFNAGTVSATGTGAKISIGGVSGQTGGSGQVRDAYNTGAVVGTASDGVGGAIGLMDNTSSMERVYSTGAVSGGSNVGGLVGFKAAGASVSASFWDTVTSGLATSAGGTGKTTAEMQTLSTFTTAGWDIDDAGSTGTVWRIYQGHTAPLLRSFMVSLDLSADNLTRTYDATRVTLDATLPGGGLVRGNGASGKNAGTYLTDYYSSQLAYDITQAVLTIDPAVVSLSGQRVYDADTGVSASVLTATGTVGGETLTITGLGSVSTKDVGTAKPVSLGTLALANGTGGSAGLASNYTLAGGTYAVDITAKAVTVSGVTASNKVYDATTAATLDTAAAQADGLITGDAVSFDAAKASGSFADGNVGTGKAVAVTGTALSGASAGNYTLTQPTGVTADITPKAVTVSGITAQNKVYDATMAATLNTAAAQANGLITGDTVSFDSASATGSFGDKNVGTGKAVTVSGTALSGASAGNYALVQPTGVTADITAKAVTVSGITAQNKVYDATLTATLDTGTASADGLIVGDAVSFNAAGAIGSFASKDVGTGKAVTVGGSVLTGASADNYTLTQPTGLTADITPKPVTVTGLTAQNKVYDATVAATLDLGAATVSGLIGGDDVRFDPVGVAARFADKNVGIGKPVTVVGGLLSGSAAGNYLLTAPGGLSADITARPVTVVGLSASGKVYDGTTAALLNLRGVRADGLIGGDDVRFDASAAIGSYADRNVGFAIPIAVSGLRLDGVDAGNYRLISPALASEINPAVLTAVAADVVKLFGSRDPLLGYQLIGEVGGDVAADFVRGQLVRDPGESAGAYAIRTGTLTVNNPNYLLVVTPATLRILPLVIASGTPPTSGTPARPDADAPTSAAALPERLPVPLRDLAPADARPRPAPPPESLAPLLRIRDGGVNMPLALLDR